MAQRWTAVAAVATTTAAAAGLSGCGAGAHSTPARPAVKRLTPYAAARADPCSSAARTTVARALHVGPGAVAVRRTRDNAGDPACRFTRPEVVVTVSVYGGPQPYGIMERRGEEEAQLFTGRRHTPAPQAVFGLGLGAFWFPAEQQLEATDAVNLITVTIVAWPGADQRRRRALSIALARGYLGPSRPKLAVDDG